MSYDVHNVETLYLNIDSEPLLLLPISQDSTFLISQEPNCKRVDPKPEIRNDIRVRSLVRSARRKLLDKFRTEAPAHYHKMSNLEYTAYMKDFLTQELSNAFFDQDEGIVKSVLMMCLNQKRFNRNLSL